MALRDVSQHVGVETLHARFWGCDDGAVRFDGLTGQNPDSLARMHVVEHKEGGLVSYPGAPSKAER